MPRWQIGLIWRQDAEPLWEEPDLLADPFDAEQAEDDSAARAEQLAKAITVAFGLQTEHLQACYEDPLAALADEVGRPTGPRPEVDPTTADLSFIAELDHSATPVAWALPLAPAWWGEGWASAAWRTRRGRLVLVRGESPAGSRLPLGSLSWEDPDFAGEASYFHPDPLIDATARPRAIVVDPGDHPSRTAVVVEARDGFVHVFLPPLEKLEKFVELVRLIGRVAAAEGTRLILEGYGPPPDPRINHLLITPDPGVIEVNVHPSRSWRELSELTQTLFRIAREQRLGTETFGLDGRHSGTGGGNHLTLGAAPPDRSPLLRRPDLLVSMLTYWQHHPSLSYLFSGRFVGPTSQAPRVDEGRPETLYELEIAFAEIEKLDDNDHRPWAVDRALRYLLTDITGNSHRSEFCIDKLYNPDALRGRLGLLELRAFEMPPHPDMALVQALLVRALVARFAAVPYSAPLIRWGSSLHEKFLLPHFVLADISTVVDDLRAHGIDFDRAWLAPFAEFRFPRIGVTRIGGTEGDGVELELRSAIEPWHVLGDDTSSGAAARYVDSSTERLQVSVRNFAASSTAGGVQRVTGAAGCGRHTRPLRRGSALQGMEAVEFVAPHARPRHATPVRPDRPGITAVVGWRDLPRCPSWWTFVRHSAGERQGGRGPPRTPVRGGRPRDRRDRRTGPRVTARLARSCGGRLCPHLGSAPAGTAPLGPLVTVTSPGECESSMTVLGRYLASVSQPDMFSTASGFDEFAAPDGTVRQGWSTLAEGLDEFAEMDLLRAQREVERLLEDDNVTYTPNPAAALSIADETDGRVPVINEPQPWKLDPCR